MSHDADKNFAGSIPEIYETHLVPQLFVPYANDLAGRLARRAPRRVLEIAAGTGVVTRAMASSLPEPASIVATDLNQGMIDKGAALGTARPVEWRQADAMHLPFDDESFDAVVCQFGVMFFPDRPKAFAEARRVLRPGGVYLFNVWDRLDTNDFSAIVTSAMAARFPENPPSFLPRTPYAYNDRGQIASDLSAGGFSEAPEIVTVTARSIAASPRDAAIALCQGTPLRTEIEAFGPDALDAATDAAAGAIAARLGPGRVEGNLQALVVSVER